MARKRAHGTGSVFRRKDGRWVATAEVDGQRVYRYRKTRKEAELALASLLASQVADDLKPVRQPPASPALSELPASQPPARSASSGQPVGPSAVPIATSLPASLAAAAPISLLSWIDQWLASCPGRLRPSTCHGYVKAMRRIRPLIDDVALTQLTPALLWSVVMRLTPHGPRAAQESYTVLRTCLEAAVDFELIPVNPMTRVPKPSWQPREREYWSVEETRNFIDHALVSHRKWAPLCAFLVSTGLRISEAFGLTWADVDLAGGRIRVREPLVYVDGKPIAGPPKTKAGKRWITVGVTGQAVLACLPPGSRKEGVFRTKNGKPPTPSNVRQTLLKLCEEVGLPPLNPHGLRHVAAMLALKATRDIYVVQRRLGHANPNVTVGIYGYSVDGDDEVADAVDRLFAEDGPPARRRTRREDAAD